MSNSLLVDDNESSQPGDLDQLRSDLSEAVKRQSAESVEREVPEQTRDLPEKYRGKSVEDVIEMHRNAESELGRRSNELGQYKKLTDDLLDLKRRDDLAKGGASAEPEEESLPEISSTDMLENPTEAVSRLLDARDQRNERRQQQKAEEDARAEVERKFVESHPDAEQITQNPDFLEWVKSSTARSLLGYQASNGDLIAGDALLTEWKASQTLSEETPAKETVDPVKAARRASTESVGSSTTPDAPSGKIYRRLDLIRLKLEDPEAYADEAFQREILKAYAENRVK